MRRSLLLWLSLIALLASAFPWQSLEAQSTPSAVILTLNQDIDSIHLRYLVSGLKRAQASGASLVILSIDTPGGDLDSMRSMVQAILASPVPVITFVAPSGARAGSAGTFIEAAGAIAAMAPATNIGAAAPISSTGADLPDTLKSKVVNDAAALMRSIADTRNRNPDLLEATVRQATSYTSQQALDGKIIDLIATNDNDLLAKINGRIVQAAGRQVTLDTRGISCEPPLAQCGSIGLNLTQQFLVFISDPTVALILFVLGALGVLIELFSPGLIAPGLFGVIALALAFLSFANLPVNWVGVGLVLFGFALILLEFHIGVFGAAGAAGILAFIIGLLLLFQPFSPVPPNISRPHVYISPWLLGGLGGGIAIAFAVILFLAWRGKRAVPYASGPKSLIGKEGKVASDLAPLGTLQAENELWSAESADGSTIPAGERVIITGVTGLVLKVQRLPAQSNGGRPLPRGAPPPSGAW